MKKPCDCGAAHQRGGPRQRPCDPHCGTVTYTPTAVLQAEALGHAPEWDPPGLSAARRWTCKTCGRAVLDYMGNIYGSAVTSNCETPPTPNVNVL